MPSYAFFHHANGMICPLLCLKLELSYKDLDITEMASNRRRKTSIFLKKKNRNGDFVIEILEV